MTASGETCKGVTPCPRGDGHTWRSTYDSATKTLALYIDGALDAKQQVSGLTTGLVGQRTLQLRIGANDWNMTGSEVDGKVDSLRISNIARSFEPLSLPATTSAASAAVPKGNLIPNGDFEFGLLGWRLAGEGDANLIWAVDTKDPASGRLSLHTIPNSAVGADLRERDSQAGPLLSRPVPARPGARMYLDRPDAIRRVRPEATISANSAGGVRSGGVNSSSKQTAEIGPEWKQLSSSFTLPQDWVAPSLCIRIDPPKNGQFWVDDVRLATGSNMLTSTLTVDNVRLEAGENAGTSTIREKIGVAAKAERVGNLFFADRKEAAALEIVNADAKCITWPCKRQSWIGTDASFRRRPSARFDLPAGMPSRRLSRSTPSSEAPTGWDSS